ncbi:MAG TPA: hypothetical protein VHA06_07715, partial [Candidatus Angelobacter sp.]|nr:hypothetical protein [Candidatus Angelobacter sp.]
MSSLVYGLDLASAPGSFVASNSAATAVMEAPFMAMPSREMLRRDPIQLETVEDMQGELAVDVENLLGYGVLRKQMKLQSPLLTLLAKLEIEPFAADTVQKYQNEMLDYARQEARRMDAAEGVHAGSVMARVARWTRH